MDIDVTAKGQMPDQPARCLAGALDPGAALLRTHAHSLPPVASPPPRCLPLRAAPERMVAAAR